MSNESLFTEGDINQSVLREKWETSHDANTKQWLDDDARYFLHQSLSTPCLDIVEESSQASFTRLNGEAFLDFHGNSAHQVGFSNPYVIEAIKKQLDRLPFCTRRYTNRPAIDLAKKLVASTGHQLERVLFAPGGSLAVGMALKLARVVTGKHKVISFWDSFHGASLDAISAGGEAIFRKNMGPTMPGTERIPAPNVYRGILGDDPMKYADYLEYVIEKEGEIGALLAEPIRNTDVVVPPKAFWQRVRQICDTHGIMLIFDEIPNGLGRTGQMYAWQHYGVVPDIMCLGKGLGGCIIPLAAIVTKDKYNIAPEISLGHYTHEKNPVACAAGLAVLNFIENENLLEKVKEDEKYISSRLLDLQNRYDIIGDVRGLGTIWGIELVKDRQTKEKASEAAEQLMYNCMTDGLSFKISSSNIIQFLPPLTIARNELDRAIEILEKNIVKI
ncbi:aspartate aminotransferase family protein [Fulvivirgaceae bacterium BMA12]|uniref:Aspartate aminotransferase family protein n=1 Tax=Agaribacillus aureus TaxID=3051825 RepID=A0ABT8L1R9_9BACT|nr:aspartate aminotransferase family protein [Fulvivirgaceae bacterium BMA12]